MTSYVQIGSFMLAYHAHSVKSVSHNYAPNFEEVDGAYWFWAVGASVHVCVHPSIQEPCMLGF